MTLAEARDWAIIVVALVSLGILVVLMVDGFLLYRLSKQVQSDLKPLINSATRTAHQMEETTKFMSDAVVAPVIKVSSLAAGLRRSVNSLGNMRIRRRG